MNQIAWKIIIVDKTSKSVAAAFQNILLRAYPRRPICLQSDKGGEFLGSDLKRVLKKNNIRFRIARSPDTKAAVAERFIRTVKERMWRFFTYKKSYRYPEVLQKIFDSYNNSKHSAIKMTPASVTLQNAAEARKNLSQRYNFRTVRTPQFKVGDHVRISRSKSVFDKGYESGWTQEIFVISKFSESRLPHVYILKDLKDEEDGGIFYEEEPSRVKKDLNEEIWEIDEVLETKGQGRRKKTFSKLERLPEIIQLLDTGEWVKRFIMKDQFYVVLPSNSSMSYFEDNTIHLTYLRILSPSYPSTWFFTERGVLPWPKYKFPWLFSTFLSNLAKDTSSWWATTLAVAAVSAAAALRFQTMYENTRRRPCIADKTLT